MAVYTAADCRLDDLVAVMASLPAAGQYPHAVGIESGAVVYDGPATVAAVADPVRRREVLAEVAHALGFEGPGIVVLRHSVEADTVDAVSDAFREMIAEQHASGAVAGDHFAKPGANDRVWNALEKLAVMRPSAFAD